MIHLGKCVSCGRRGWRLGRWGNLYLAVTSDGKAEVNCAKCVEMGVKAYADREYRRLVEDYV